MARPAFLLAALITLIIFGVGELPGPMWILTTVCVAISSWRLLAQPSGATLNQGNPYLIRFLWAGLMFYMIIMIVPLEHDHMLFSSQRAEQNAVAHNILNQDPVQLLTDYTFSQSRNRAGTFRMFLLCLCAISVFHWSINLGNSQAHTVLAGIVVIGTLTAICGFISQHVIEQGKHFWWLFPIQDGQPVGAFPNRSHFGGYVALIAPLALCLAAGSYKNNKLWCVAWLACASICIGCVAASLSRGAWISLAAGLLVTVVLLRHMWKRAVVAAGIVIISGLTAVVIFLSCGVKDSQASHPIAERAATFNHLLDTPSAGFRMQTWSSATKVMRDYALLGAGPEGFRTVFAQYRDESRRLSFKHAENEYIQLVTDTGAAGVLLCVLAVSTWVSLRRSIPVDNDHLLTMVAIPTLVVAGTHATVDFALHRPLYALTVVLICGLSTCGAQRTNTTRFKLVDRVLAGVITLSLILILVMGRKIYDYDRSTFIRSATLTEIHESIKWAPSYWNAWYRLGRFHWNAGDKKSQEYAEICISQAAYYDPNNYRVWQTLYHIRRSLGMTDEARVAYQRAIELRNWLNLDPPKKGQP